jgi:hypothetical protein
MGADGGGQTNLTNNPATDGEPNWSPNGGAVLLLQSDRDGSDDVFVMGANGSGPASLTRTAGHDGRPDWAVALTPPPPPPPPSPSVTTTTVPTVPPVLVGGPGRPGPGGPATISLRKTSLSGVRWASGRVRATVVLTGRAAATKAIFAHFHFLTPRTGARPSP